MASLRWLLLDFTDPRFDLTLEQKREVRQRARRIRFFDRPVFTTGMPLTNETREATLRRRSAASRLFSRLPIIALYVCWLVLLMYLPYAATNQSLESILLTGAIAVPALWVITCWILFVMARPWYQYAMYELGYAICAECGYPLRGLEASKRCPECGWRKTHRDSPPPVKWTDADRRTLRNHGYETCTTCGGLMLQRDQTCPRCGDTNDVPTTAT